MADIPADQPAGTTSDITAGTADRAISFPKLDKTTVWIYGSLSFPLAMIAYPLGVWIPRLYSTEVGLDLGLIGSVFFFAAIFDAFSDPIMGHYSDRLETRWGRRRPWLVIGVPFYAIAVWMLLNPGHDATIAYLAFFYIMLRAAATTVVGLPYGAWGMELSGEYHTRTMIQSARERYVMMGLMGASAIVLFSEQVWEGRPPASFVLENFSWVIITILPLATLLILWRVPEVPTFNAPHVPFLSSLKLMYKNKLFARLLCIELLIAGGENFRNTLSLFFIQDYIGSGMVGWLYLIYFGVGFGAIWIWDWLARKWGKHVSLAIAMVFVGAVSLGCFMLEYGQVMEFYVLFALKGFCFGAFAYLPRAMLADVVDVDTVRSISARPASYYAILGFMTKCAASFGGLSLPMLAFVGFSTAPHAQNGPTELLWLGVLYAIVPTIMFGIAFCLCVTWPLNAKMHARLQQLVERKQERHLRRTAGG